ncbi:protease IV [Bradyrhizobium diazoefficiens]|uniref:protease IV n=1 Tax=Bradyrhizobium diazoefficiens TaxID=1355477 RepID=UPI000BEABC56|nr:protease IV [Bradyrhizobium diazoefficiens]PDT58731.1 protease IV [Bradyrhizobium diazoefficiens]QLD43827.1 protease IV [Bradyrhizobium diazoefficiens]
MSGAVISIIVRLFGLAGVKLSPFWAGAALAGVIALLIGGSAVAAGVHLYNAGYAAADGAWREKALEAQLAAAHADAAEARRAAGDAALRAEAIKEQAEQERAGTDAYVDDLRKRAEALAASGKPNICGLTCDDLRGMRIKSAACPAPAGSAGGIGADLRARARSIRKPQ